MQPSPTDVLRELERILASGLLTPQERVLLRRLVKKTLEGSVSGLYQKALAEELGISSAKQIGVIATRVRAKLIEYYELPASSSDVQITMAPRGYEVTFSYRSAVSQLGDRIQLLLANAKAAIAQRTLPGAAAALRYVDLALAEEPGDSLLLAVKAQCHAARALYGSYPRKDLEAAQVLVGAIPRSERRPWQSWFAEGSVRMALHWDWAGAETAFQRAIELSDGEAQYHPWYTAFLSCRRRPQEAVEILRVAVGRAHDSPVVRADLAINQIFAGQFDDASETIDTTMALFGPRTHYLSYVHRAILHEARGEGQAAVDAIHRVPLKWPKTTITLGLRALFSGLNGDQRTARRHLSKLKIARAVAGQFVPAGQLCAAALGAGDYDDTVRWLQEAAIVERDPNILLSNMYPFFRHLHQHAGFRALIQDTLKLRLAA